MGFFQPTAGRDAGTRGHGDAETGREGEGERGSERAPRRNRAWEQRPENKVFAFRIGDELNGLLLDAVEEYLESGWQTTISDVLKAWALAGRERWMAGEVEVNGKAVRSGRRKRKRADDSGDAGGP